MWQERQEEGSKTALRYRELPLPGRRGLRLAEVDRRDQEALIMEAYRHIERHLDLYRIREIIARPAHKVYVALGRDDEWVGLLWCAEGEGFYGRPAGFVYLVAVRKGHRGRGIGRWLMELAEWWAREHGFDAIELNVDGNNPPARHLYRSQGYQELRVRMRKTL